MYWYHKITPGVYLFIYLFLIFIQCSPFTSRSSMGTWFNPFSTRPHQNVVWYNNSWLGFLKILNYMYVPKERTIFCKKISPHLSQFNIAMARRNYFRQNNLWFWGYRCSLMQSQPYFGPFTICLKPFLLQRM